MVIGLRSRTSLANLIDQIKKRVQFSLFTILKFYLFVLIGSAIIKRTMSGISMLRLSLVLVFVASPCAAAVKGTRGHRRDQVQPCQLCDESRQRFIQDDNLISCYNVKKSIASTYQDNTYECVAAVKADRDRCCEPINFLDRLERIGTYAECDLCSGVYPTIPSGVLGKNTIYGSGSCDNYWEAGLLGQLPPSVCTELAERA